MSISISEIREGGFYVNDKRGLVKQVWLFASTGHVHWRSFHLGSGDPANDSCACEPRTLARWASRIATAEEAARMKTEYAEIIERATIQDVVTRLFGENDPITLLL